MTHAVGRLILRHATLVERLELDERVRMIDALEDGRQHVRDTGQREELRRQREQHFFGPLERRPLRRVDHELEFPLVFVRQE